MKTRHCDQCKHWNPFYIPPACVNNHRPRFYLPKSPMDTNFGWKRKCEDFEVKEVA